MAKTADETTPLLYTRVSSPPPPPKPLSAVQSIATTSFSAIRILRGLLFITFPNIALSAFNIPTTGTTFLLGAFVGSRDLLLGGLLATSTPFVTREVYRALLVSLLSDATDTCVLIFAAACTWHVRTPVLEIVFVAMLAILEHLTLFSMSGDDEADEERARHILGYQKMLQASEDKQNRLDTWLLEMRRAEEVRMASESPRPSSIAPGV